MTIDVAAAREKLLLPTGDSGRGPAASWAYTTTAPSPSWREPDFDDSAWRRGGPGFGTDGTPAVAVRTPWESDAIWLRTAVTVPDLGPNDALTLHLFHDEDVEVFVNGRRLVRARGYLTRYADILLDDVQKGLFSPGRNVVAVSCRQTGGGQGIDLGLGLVREE